MVSGTISRRLRLRRVTGRVCVESDLPCSAKPMPRSSLTVKRLKLPSPYDERQEVHLRIQMAQLLRMFRSSRARDTLAEARTKTTDRTTRADKNHQLSSGRELHGGNILVNQRPIMSPKLVEAASDVEVDSRRTCPTGHVDDTSPPSRCSCYSTIALYLLFPRSHPPLLLPNK